MNQKSEAVWFSTGGKLALFVIRGRSLISWCVQSEYIWIASIVWSMNFRIINYFLRDRRSNSRCCCCCFWVFRCISYKSSIWASKSVERSRDRLADKRAVFLFKYFLLLNASHLMTFFGLGNAFGVVWGLHRVSHRFTTTKMTQTLVSLWIIGNIQTLRETMSTWSCIIFVAQKHSFVVPALELGVNELSSSLSRDAPAMMRPCEGSRTVKL